MSAFKQPEHGDRIDIDRNQCGFLGLKPDLTGECAHFFHGLKMAHV